MRPLGCVWNKLERVDVHLCNFQNIQTSHVSSEGDETEYKSLIWRLNIRQGHLEMRVFSKNTETQLQTDPRDLTQQRKQQQQDFYKMDQWAECWWPMDYQEKVLEMLSDLKNSVDVQEGRRLMDHLLWTISVALFPKLFPPRKASVPAPSCVP